MKNKTKEDCERFDNMLFEAGGVLPLLDQAHRAKDTFPLIHSVTCQGLHKHPTTDDERTTAMILCHFVIEVLKKEPGVFGSITLNEAKARMTGLDPTY